TTLKRPEPIESNTGANLMGMNTFATGLAGLNTNGQGLNVVGNNLANLNTVGFKASNISFSEVIGRLGAQVSGIHNTFGQGGVQTSANPLDVAIQGRGFLVQSNNGNRFYTRNGSLHLDSAGALISAYVGLDPATPPALADMGIPPGSVTVPALANGAVLSPITWKLAGNATGSGITGFSSPSEMSIVNQNGSAPGSMSSI